LGGKTKKEAYCVNVARTRRKGATPRWKDLEVADLVGGMRFCSTRVIQRGGRSEKRGPGFGGGEYPGEKGRKKGRKKNRSL